MKTSLDQQYIKDITGTFVNPTSEVYPLTITLCGGAVNIIKRITRKTGIPYAEVLKHVQENVISYEDVLEYVEHYSELPCACVCEEIYMLGFDTWFKLNEL